MKKLETLCALPDLKPKIFSEKNIDKNHLILKLQNKKKYNKKNIL